MESSNINNTERQQLQSQTETSVDFNVQPSKEAKIATQRKRSEEERNDEFCKAENEKLDHQTDHYKTLETETLDKETDGP